MAKKDKSADAAAGTEGQAAAKPEKVAAPKVEKIYFLDRKYATPDSVFGRIKAVIGRDQNLAEGKGVSTPDIVADLLKTFQPKKTARYGESYLRSYIRDLEKFGYATTDQSKAVAELTPAPVTEKSEKSGKKKSGGVSEAGKKILVAMNELISEDEYKNNVTSVTAEVLGTKLGSKQMTLAKSLESLAKNELIQMRKDGEVIYFNFTDKSWGVNYSEAQAAAA